MTVDGAHRHGSHESQHHATVAARRVSMRRVTAAAHHAGGGAEVLNTDVVVETIMIGAVHRAASVTGEPLVTTVLSLPDRVRRRSHHSE